MKSIAENQQNYRSDRISDMPKARQAIKTAPEESVRKRRDFYDLQVFYENFNCFPIA
jgi:hypothetical protein